MQSYQSIPQRKRMGFKVDIAPTEPATYLLLSKTEREGKTVSTISKKISYREVSIEPRYLETLMTWLCSYHDAICYNILP